jgi:superfamily I DNA and/or RNA helicase/very-short-patch-repair endonuclease
MAEIRDIIERDRLDLLDLSRRNIFLNYRYQKTRGVEIRNASAPTIFQSFVYDEKPIVFSGKEDETDLASQSALELLFDDSTEEGVRGAVVEAARVTDRQILLNSNETQKKINSRLLVSYLNARSYIEEQGVNLLYIAFGMLEWRDPNDPEKANLAPLLLVPAKIDRGNVREKFSTTYDGGEVQFNLTLKLKLEKEFSIDLPTISDEEVDPQSYFNDVATSVEQFSDWKVIDDILALGFFSFGKFLMYRDLDEENWADAKKPSENSIIQSLLSENGFDSAPSRFSDREKIDQNEDLSTIALVKDADSTQVLAIAEALDGRNLVIEGPPGTGKSQTITNLIAESLKRGKTVLFVAEKKAALDVVKRRLDEVQLGDACLELHSNKANKKDVIAELRRTYGLGMPIFIPDARLPEIRPIRDELNKYCEAVNCPIGSSNVTPIEAYGRLIRIQKNASDGQLPKLALSNPEKWTPDQYHKLHSAVRNAEVRLNQIGTPTENVFFGSRLTSVLPHEQSHLLQLIIDCIKSTAQLQSASNRLASQLGVTKPKTIKDVNILINGAKRASDSPTLRGVRVNVTDWQLRRNELDEIIEKGREWAGIHDEFNELLLPQIWRQDLLVEREELLRLNEKWWRFLVRDYRQAKKTITKFLKNPKLAKQIVHIDVAEAVIREGGLREYIDRHESLGVNLFGDRWQGANSDWRFVEEITEWIYKLYDDIGEGQLPDGIVNFFAGEPNKEKLQSQIETAALSLTTQTERANELNQFLDIDLDALQPTAAEDHTVSKISAKYSLWQEHISDIQTLTQWNNLREELGAAIVEFNDTALLQLITMAKSWPEARSRLSAVLEQSYLEGLLEGAYGKRPELRTFTSSGHEEKVKDFIDLDQKLIEQNRAEIALQHWKTTPRTGATGQLGILRREFEKKKRHLPLRRLMERTGNAIQAMKPVFMMSPLSIANYLSPDSIDFDLIIFDEASQVRPVEAFGAALRGKQIVVVGDSMQLPPSSFFDKLTPDDEFDEEAGSNADIESILGLMRAQGSPVRMLKWHYRSRHESLIAVSNKELYENSLQIFPSPDANKRDVGLTFQYLPDTHYEPGKDKRYNLEEAEAVAAAVMTHAKASPNRSLLVATFSIAQKYAIWNKLELKRRSDSSCESFFNPNKYEPFDVKNLESVQGDERDVVFISIGYGKTEEGKVSLTFGPVTHDGGERRLNVLATRAKYQCKVFSNITAADIDLRRTPSKGVAVLKTFLNYAQNGILETPTVSDRQMESPFEEEVCEALVSLGYDIVPQVGAAGYFIDLAVVDSEQPGRYVLGIECDGAAYHDALSARDRDRLRQQVLEDLGWRIYRIWSTDWFRNRDRELKKVVDAIENASLKEPKQKTKATAPKITKLKRSSLKTTDYPSVISDYEIASVDSQEASTAIWTENGIKMKSLIGNVVSIEGPVHREEIFRRIATAADIQRIGSRIRSFMERTCARVVAEESIIEKDGFLSMPDSPINSIRNRSRLPNSSKKFAYISDEEIMFAMHKVILDSFGIEEAPLVKAISQMFGINRVSDQIQDRVSHLVVSMLDKQSLVNSHGVLKVANG